MDFLSIKIKYLPLKTLVVSLLVHLIIFETFIFVFPVRSPEKKPNMIFLGSFLTAQDISPIQSSPKTHSGNVSYGNTLYRIIDFMPKTFSDVTRINKPLFLERTVSEEKVSTKIPAESLGTEEQRSGTLLEDIDEEPTTKPYQRLRLRQP